MSSVVTPKIVKGGSFLIQETNPKDMFTREDLTEDQHQIADLTRKFMENEVLPRVEEIENQKWDVTVGLIKKAGELGLLSFDIPEEYGGLGLDKTSSMLVTETISMQGSFTVSFGAHTSIGSLPIVFFGTPQQKEYYLPKIATAELISAYALTEPNSGSDALAAKTKAVLSPDGKHYILNGTKMWISNGGFADMFIVFAKVDGDKFTAFIVERSFPGVSSGHDEKKMGLKGSSTTTVILEDAMVPVENVLGEIGKGHKIAFNVLNMGRFKLGAGSVGGAKNIIPFAVKYAHERKQFNKSISDFGLIKHKIAEIVTRVYASESMTYRTSGLLDDYINNMDKNNPEDVMKSLEEYAVECSMIKVYASEMLDYVADEALQIFGGYGYSQEYPVERFYRDARINRIFEGTNEINRMLAPGMLLKKAMRGELPLMQAGMKIMEEVMSLPSYEEDEETLLSVEKKLVANCKKATLLAAGVAIQKYMGKINDEQEILASICDAMMEVYAMESTLLRTLKMIGVKGEDQVLNQIDATRLFINDAVARVDIACKNVLATASDGDNLRMQLSALKRFTKMMPINTVEIRRRLSDKVVEAGKYIF
ncbi:MAG: acyl-CoA dehydrogenase family protein [Candidatus Sericytochromatia bacterium]|nr:acyl-CoA dehydrogenase family protein [Candidatus Sericytochromatia bacterium]